ncbi:hypothetical protein [Streptomyces sp. 7N604]|uniref:hypothetical protein n=1 Tax=Streptomyces sp. 7N604 TaxID=3457415 RepID=UPI003FD686DD
MRRPDPQRTLFDAIKAIGKELTVLSLRLGRLEGNRSPSETRALSSGPSSVRSDTNDRDLLIDTLDSFNSELAEHHARLTRIEAAIPRRTQQMHRRIVLHQRIHPRRPRTTTKVRTVKTPPSHRHLRKAVTDA